MPTVPFDSRRSSPDMPVPSETDLWMALATMKDLGRIPLSERLDPSLQGQVEDRRGGDYPPDQAQAAREMASKKNLIATKRPADQVFKEFDRMKLKRLNEFSSASTGVSGGSR